MRMKLNHFFAVIAFAACGLSVQAQPINTTPQGMIAVTLTSGSVTYLSLPLEATPSYTGAVGTIGTTNTTSDTITSGDSPAPFTTNYGAAGQPYFVKMLSGAQSGRIIFIKSNTTSSLTLDTTDGIGLAEPLSGNSDANPSTGPTTFNVMPGDTYEVFPGETLGSVFGDNVNNTDGTTNPIRLTAGNNLSSADTVTLPSTTTSPSTLYFFSLRYGYWVQYGSTSATPANSNGTRINPYSPMVVNIQTGNPTVTLPLLGQVTEVPLLTKTVTNVARFTSTQIPSDVAFSQLDFGTNFVKGNSVGKADTVSLYNPNETPPRFDIYYEDNTSTWRKYPDPTTSYNTNTIPVASCIIINKNNGVQGAESYIQSSLPYTNN
jgi:hypothetical protein